MTSKKNPHYYILLSLLITIFSISIYAEPCNLLIHGYTTDTENYFGELPHQITWNAIAEIPDAAEELAANILTEIQTCDPQAPIVLRVHSYGAAITFYILGQGKRFSKMMPDHNFVKIYKLTTAVYSYAGAYHGTQLMDTICSGGTTRLLGRVFGKPCVKSLTTDPLLHATNTVTDPGVPIHLIYSTNSRKYLGTIGTLIGRAGLTWEQISSGFRNQNDSILPQSSTRGCLNQPEMFKKTSNCKKINSNYFIDFFRTDDDGHNDFLENEEFMLRINDDI